jgi:hypothetical protein
MDCISTDADARNDDVSAETLLMRRYGKTFTDHVALSLLTAVIISVLCINRAQADGGTVQFSKSSGPFAITVFTTPSPLRAGPVDISLMIQGTDNQEPLLDCIAEIQLRKEGESSISSEATHGAAQNKLFYAAQVKIPVAGVWEVEAVIRRGDDSAKVSGPISLAASNPVLLGYWRSLAIPPIFISLFALNQWLRRRRTAGYK